MEELNQSAERRRESIIAFVCVVFLILLTFGCQIVIFEGQWNQIGFSVLVGTCSTLFGAFAALLASPYGADDKERLTKVSATLVTLVTGYLLAKIIDPLIAETFRNPANFFEIKNATNSLMAITGFLGGFLGTYEYRAYISGKTLEIKQAIENKLITANNEHNQELIKVAEKDELHKSS